MAFRRGGCPSATAIDLCTERLDLDCHLRLSARIYDFSLPSSSMRKGRLWSAIYDSLSGCYDLARYSRSRPPSRNCSREPDVMRPGVPPALLHQQTATRATRIHRQSQTALASQSTTRSTVIATNGRATHSTRHVSRGKSASWRIRPPAHNAGTVCGWIAGKGPVRSEWSEAWQARLRDRQRRHGSQGVSVPRSRIRLVIRSGTRRGQERNFFFSKRKAYRRHGDGRETRPWREIDGVRRGSRGEPSSSRPSSPRRLARRTGQEWLAWVAASLLGQGSVTTGRQGMRRSTGWRRHWASLDSALGSDACNGTRRTAVLLHTHTTARSQPRARGIGAAGHRGRLVCWIVLDPQRRRRREGGLEIQQ